jgi:hypothetical protein
MMEIKSEETLSIYDTHSAILDPGSEARINLRDIVIHSPWVHFATGSLAE